MSPYITFCSLKRNEVKEQYPHATFGDIGRLLGGMWATLDPEEKLMYIQMANEKNQQILNYSTQEQEIKQQQIEQDLEQQQQLREQQQLQQQSESMSNIPTDVLNTNGTGNSYPNQLNVHLNQSSAIPVHDLQHPSSAAAMPESKIKTPSAYVNFCRAFRADVRDKYPGASISEQGRILGQMWSNTDENSRKVCYSRYYSLSMLILLICHLKCRYSYILLIFILIYEHIY